MIIIAFKPGQLANRLFLFAKFIAYGLEHSVFVINPSFDDYASYFDKTSKQFIPASKNVNGFSSRLILKILYFFCFYTARALHRFNFSTRLVSVAYLDWTERYDLDSDLRLASNGIHFVQGWEFEADRLLQTHRAAIKTFFTPASHLLKIIDTFWRDLSTQQILVGVHIRHGDYKTFEGGRYFYETKSYVALMQMLAMQNPGVKFLVCTNSKDVALSQFDTLDVVLAPGHELADLYLLSKCHYIMGPPSTYSLWASYIGEVSLYQITDVEAPIHLSKFVLPR